MSLDISLVCPCCGTEVYECNITHNLNTMAKEAGIDQALWHPEDVRIEVAGDMTASIYPGYMDITERPEYYRQFDAENGWGTYDDFIPWLDKLLNACQKWPNAEVRAYR